MSLSLRHTKTTEEVQSTFTWVLKNEAYVSLMLSALLPQMLMKTSEASDLGYREDWTSAVTDLKVKQNCSHKITLKLPHMQ